MAKVESPGGSGDQNEKAKDERYDALLAELQHVRAVTEQIQRDNERQDKELHVMSGLDALRNVLENGFGDMIGQLQPLRELAPTSPAVPLPLNDYLRFLVLRETMARIIPNSYDIPIAEKPVGFLHDSVPPAVPPSYGSPSIASTAP